MNNPSSLLSRLMQLLIAHGYGPEKAGDLLMDPDVGIINIIGNWLDAIENVSDETKYILKEHIYESFGEI